MIEILKKCPLFIGLDGETIERLLASSSYMINRYEQNALIARRDTAYSGLLIIVEGSVRGTIMQSNGNERVIDIIGAGQLIAPAFLFGGYNRLPIDVYANETVRIMTLHRGSLFEMMQDNTVVLSNFIDIVSNRANFFSRKIYALTVLMLKEKVAGYLYGLAVHDSELKLDIAAMALALDTTRESCVQTLSELERKGLIKVEGELVYILNREAIRQLAV